MTRQSLLVAILAAIGLVTTPTLKAVEDPPLDQIKLRPGFKIEVYAANVEGARQMALTPGGTLFVGSRRQGNVYAIVDQNKDQKADEVIVIAKGLNSPNGVAFRNGALYVAELSRVLRYDDIEAKLKSPPQPVVVTDKLPTEAHHGWKFIAFGPDGKLYVPVGAPCNVCDKRSEDPRFASIMRMNPDGSGAEIFAHGIRNSVGFDWHPVTNDLWFTNNGRDMMGDNVPPDTLHHAPKAGIDFGFPYCFAGDIPDPEFGKVRKCSAFTPPAQKLGPHVASLGMLFYTGSMFPADYRYQILIAEHGSWNRSQKIGYRLSLVKLDASGKPASYETFAEGWLQGQQNWGRPVDVHQAADGGLLVSDDQAHVIYRISYSR